MQKRSFTVEKSQTLAVQIKLIQKFLAEDHNIIHHINLMKTTRTLMNPEKERKRQEEDAIDKAMKR